MQCKFNRCDIIKSSVVHFIFISIPIIIAALTFASMVDIGLKQSSAGVDTQYEAWEMGEVRNSLCMSIAEMNITMQSYNQIPIFSGSSLLLDDRGGFTQNRNFLLFANLEDGGWTLIERKNENEYCIPAFGFDMQMVLK